MMEVFIPRKGQVMISTCQFKSSFKEHNNWTKYVRKGADLTITEVYLASNTRRVSLDNYAVIGSLLISRKSHEIQWDMSDLRDGMRIEFRLDDLNRVFTQRDINKVVVPYLDLFSYLKEKEDKVIPIVHTGIFDNIDKKNRK
jgi:hypothetical protein